MKVLNLYIHHDLYIHHYKCTDNIKKLQAKEQKNKQTDEQIKNHKKNKPTRETKKKTDNQTH